MSSEDVKGLVETTLKNNKGPFGVIGAILTISIIVLQLPPDYIERLEHAWLIITVPSVLTLFGGLGQAYLNEQKTRTKVEADIALKLDKLSNHIERVVAKSFDDRMYFDTELEKFSVEHGEIKNRLDRIYLVLEKRKDSDVMHSGDTTKFLHQS